MPSVAGTRCAFFAETNGIGNRLFNRGPEMQRMHSFSGPAGRAMRRSGKNLASGLRIRGEGDYVLIPPSVYPSGVSHTYLDPDAAIVAALQWLPRSGCSIPHLQAWSGNHPER